VLRTPAAARDYGGAARGPEFSFRVASGDDPVDCNLLAPFSDHTELTPADRQAYTSCAKTERHKSFENIDVSFGNPPRPDPRDHKPEKHPPGR
jgi:hypothetical protein